MNIPDSKEIILYILYCFQYCNNNIPVKNLIKTLMGMGEKKIP